MKKQKQQKKQLTEKNKICCPDWRRSIMKQKKIPMRKCTGCGEMKEKRQLVRVVKAPDVKDENES